MHGNDLEDQLKTNHLSRIAEDHLIPNASTGESKVFYYKMKGDYYRYLAEFTAGGMLVSAREADVLIRVPA